MRIVLILQNFPPVPEHRLLLQLAKSKFQTTIVSSQQRKQLKREYRDKHRREVKQILFFKPCNF